MQSKSLGIFAALGLIVASACSASAAIIHFGAQNIPIPTTFEGVSVNLEDGSTTNLLAGAPGMDANFFLGGQGISNDADETALTPSWQPVRSAATNTDPVVNLAPGTVIDGTAVTGNDFGASGGTVTHFATFVSGTPGYIGFKIELADTTMAHGWMRVTLQNDNTPGVIHEWAYEDTGASIEVGQIPEPSHSMLALLGLAALSLRRRRR